MRQERPMWYLVRVKQGRDWTTVYQGSDRGEAWATMTSSSPRYPLVCMSEAPAAAPVAGERAP